MPADGRRATPPTTTREGAGRVSPEQLAAWAARAYPNMVLMLANLPNNDMRRREIAGYETRCGQAAADQLRRDVWAQMQIMAKGPA
jgi:hypothetical protein